MYFGRGIWISFGKNHISFFKFYGWYFFDFGILLAFTKTFSGGNPFMKILFILMLVFFFF